jgi:glutathione peroxidase
MTLRELPVRTITGEDITLEEFNGRALLVVNVASQCGATPQYAGLEELYRRYNERGLTVLGFPCNQFGEQEPGDAAEINRFCTTTYGVSFPMFSKVEVNGPARHPLFAELTKAADAEGRAGAIRWNFEKFLVAPNDRVVGRFRTGVTPDDPALVAAIEASLPQR